jgi:hypothetical protein
MRASLIEVVFNGKAVRWLRYLGGDSEMSGTFAAIQKADAWNVCVPIALGKIRGFSDPVVRLHQP